VLEVRDATVQVTTALTVGDELDAGRRGRVQLAGPARVEVGGELFVSGRSDRGTGSFASPSTRARRARSPTSA
jgi:hypothetical protein